MSWNSLRVYFGLTSICVVCALLVAAQSTASPNKNRKRVDRRYAISSGDWSRATVSIFNTWSAFDDNPGRHMIVYLRITGSRIEVVGNKAVLYIGRTDVRTDIDRCKQTRCGSWVGRPIRQSIRYLERVWRATGLGIMQVYGCAMTPVCHEFPKVEGPAGWIFERRVRSEANRP